MFALLNMVRGLMFGLSSFYHPMQDGANAHEAIMNHAAYVALAAIVVATAISIFCRRIHGMVMLALLGALVAGHVGGRAYVRLTNPQPDFILRYVGDEPYAIPRHYGPYGTDQPGQSFELLVE